MSRIGKKIRMTRIFRQDGRTLIFAFDHGAILGPVRGAEDISWILEEVISGGVDAIMTTLGVIKNYGPSFSKKGLGWILTLQDKNPLTASQSMTLASQLGVDAVKIFVRMGGEEQWQDLETLWSLAKAGEEYGIPVLAEMYPVKTGESSSHVTAEYIAKISRIAAEYGADIIKTFYTGSEESFRYVVKVCPVPIVVLGGERAKSDVEFLRDIASSIKAGGAGAAVGRNIFEHPNPKLITKALSAVIHDNLPPEEAAALISPNKRREG
ncbi:MAG: hypothetical protein LM590_09665 [Thermofilum sp.]|jgi:fructose-bisphosphate aldolase/2-amino-3,7-dideoxy-D-threo-hept-6-ulosonate synthase|nr:hypothetical protein [Thermofilum sp.]